MKNTMQGSHVSTYTGNYTIRYYNYEVSINSFWLFLDYRSINKYFYNQKSMFYVNYNFFYIF